MSLTFKQARDILAKFVGRGGQCPEPSPEVDDFVLKALQQLLYSGEYGGIRKFCFHAVKGCFTIPYELETPEKVKIDNCPGNVWNKWFEWHQPSQLMDCVPAGQSIFEEPNYFYTAYELPPTAPFTAPSTPPDAQLS